MASRLNNYPSPPDGTYSEVHMNALRGHILGVSLDNAVNPGVDDWFVTSGSASNRNNIATTEKVITKLLNNLDSSLNVSTANVDGFNDRFSNVVGNEATVDQQAFEKIGSNLINAIVNLQDLSEDLVSLPTWDSDNYILTFKTGAGDDVVINLPLELLALGLDYDPDKKEIVLITQDGTRMGVSVEDLVALYEGSTGGLTIDTFVSEDNIITAELKLNSIGEEHLSGALKSIIENSARISKEVYNILERKDDGLYVSGIQEHQIQVSQSADNLIEQKQDGIYVAPVSTDKDNYVASTTDNATIVEKEITIRGTNKPTALIVGQFYSILFPNGHTASRLRFAVEAFAAVDVYYSNDVEIPKNLIPANSVHLFAFDGRYFNYVGKNHELTVRGIFTVDFLPPYQGQATIPITNLVPVTSDVEPTFDSTILDSEGRIGRVIGIASNVITVYTIKESYKVEHPVDDYSIIYDETEMMKAIRFADNVKNAATGKVTSIPNDLAQTEFSISTSANNRRLISVRKDDGTVAWQLRSNKGNIATTLDISNEDDLMNKGEIEELIRESEGTGLRIPIFIDTEEELPQIDENIPDGTYYMVANMTISAPGSEGRVWYNKEVDPDHWQVFVTRGRDLDWDWIIADENNDISFNHEEKVIMTTAGVVLQNDTGKVASINALMEVDQKVSGTFQGRIMEETMLPLIAATGYWYIVDNLNNTSIGNSGLAVYDGANWEIAPFEANIPDDIDFIPEPADDGQLYFRRNNMGHGEWIEYKNVNGSVRTITANVKRSNVNGSFVPEKGELVYLDDKDNFTIGNGVGTIDELPLMYVPSASSSIDLNSLEKIAMKGAPQGYTPLDGNSKIPSVYLPETITETYTKIEVDNKIEASRLGLQTNIAIEGTTRASEISRIETKIDSHIADDDIHVTSAEKYIWDNKIDADSLTPYDNHVTNPDIHVTWADKQKWDGHISAMLVNSITEMYAIPIGGLQLGDTCFVRISAVGVTPAQYDKYVWYGATTGGWNNETASATIIDLDWGGIKNRPVSTVAQIDNAVASSHRHTNINTLNKISEVGGQFIYNGVPIGTTVIFYANDAQLPSVGTERIMYIIYRDRRASNFPTISIWRDNRYEIVSGSGTGVPSPVGNMLIQQRELFGVVAGSEFLLEVSESPNFAFFPIEILRLIEGAKSQSRIYSNFTNPNHFDLNKDLLRIQNGIVTGPFEISMNRYNQVSDRYYYSKTIDITNYHSVDEIY